MEKQNIFNKIYILNHSPINAYFSKNSSDFVVREVPLYEWSGDGEHLIVEIQKKDFTTYDALHLLSEVSGVKMRDFGYAGLKDKEGMTTQFISMPRKFEKTLENFSHEKMKILSLNCHNNKLRIGHLKGNNFFIKLKKVNQIEAQKLSNALTTLDKIGFANYFGYQRFGKFGDNANEGRAILSGEKKIKNPKISKLVISAYQSDLFNSWLSKRVEISKFCSEFSQKEIADIYKFDKDVVRNLKNQTQFYKLFEGEVLGHYPFGKCFICEDLQNELERFAKRDITSMGLIFGCKTIQAKGLAKHLEDEIFYETTKFMDKLNGTRRFAWSYLDALEYKYNEDMAQFSLSFYLPKGSYATVILEEILHRDIFDDCL